MKQRMVDLDYSQRQIYMITIAVEGRRPLLGHIESDEAAVARMVLSDLGKQVSREIEGIPRFYPQVRILGKQVMPDHLHFILFVTERLPVHLGRVINGFKVGCNRAYRRLCMPEGGQASPPQRGEQHNTLSQQASPPQRGEQHNTQDQQASLPQRGEQHDTQDWQGGDGEGCSVLFPASVRQEGAGGLEASHGAQHPLFESGYHDRILTGRQQLQTMIDYIHDNTRRLLLKRQHRAWLKPRFGLTLGSHTYSAIGNIELLRCPRLMVRVSRRCNEEQIAKHIEECLSAAHRGTVLISPAISPGEKRVMRAAFQARLPLVVLMENGFTPFSKPHGEQFDACAEGRLLLLSPWEHHDDRHALTARQCQEMNLMAMELCEIQLPL